MRAQHFTYILDFKDAYGYPHRIKKEDYDQIVILAKAHYALGAGMIKLSDSEGETYALDDIDDKERGHHGHHR